MQNVHLNQELDFNEHLFTPIEGTEYSRILSKTFQKKCPSNQFLRIPSEFDTIMTVKSSKRIFQFLTQDEFDMDSVEAHLKEKLGEVYLSSKAEIE